MPTNPDDPQRSPNVEAEVAAVHAASTQAPAALQREMDAVPTAVFTVIDTTAEKGDPWWSDHVAAAMKAGIITEVAVGTESKGDDTDFPQGPTLSKERLARVRGFAQATTDRLRAEHEEMEARPDLVEEPMKFPFSLQRSTLAGPPVITFTDGYVSKGRGHLSFQCLDSHEDLMDGTYTFDEGETRGFCREGGRLQFSITYRKGEFYYTGQDLRTRKMVR